MSRGLRVDYGVKLPEKNPNGRWYASDIVRYFVDKYALSSIEPDEESYSEHLDTIGYLLGNTCILSDEDEELAVKLFDQLRFDNQLTNCIC